MTIFALAFLALSPLAYGQNDSPRLSADERLAASIFGQTEIGARPFARTVLLASGSSPEQTESFMQELDAAWKEIAPALQGELTEEEKADKILFYIYEKFLSKYNFYQTRVDTALESGVYNCVSSAIIFMYFCKRSGIPVCAEETPRHAFCVIFTKAGPIDVETTNPYGVNPGKKRGQDLGGGKTKWITVPAKDYAGRRKVDDRRVIGMVYNNRIVQLQKKRLNASTVGLAVDAYEVQGRSELSRRDLELCVGNAAADLSASGRDQDAIDFLKSAEERFGQCDSWTRKIQNAYRNLLLEKTNSLPYADAAAELDANKGNLAARDFAELKEYLYLWHSQKAAQAQDWPAALELVQEGLAEFPQSKRLLNYKSIFTQNYAADFHNAAADLFNAGKRNEAVAKIKQGLAALPQNKILLSDLEKMQAR